MEVPYSQACLAAVCWQMQGAWVVLQGPAPNASARCATPRRCLRLRGAAELTDGGLAALAEGACAATLRTLDISYCDRCWLHATQRLLDGLTVTASAHSARCLLWYRVVPVLKSSSKGRA